MCHGPREQAGCGCAPRDRHEQFTHHHYSPGEEFSGGFGIRRPLRFLAWKLGLSEPQLEKFAAVINELKTERAQAAVDDRRALTLLADAASGDGFDAGKAEEAAKLRVDSTQRLQKRVADSLAALHAVLDTEQRGRLAYLLRTGTLSM